MGLWPADKGREEDGVATRAEQERLVLKMSARVRHLHSLTLLQHATWNGEADCGPLFPPPCPSSRQMHLPHGASSLLAELPDLPIQKDLVRCLLFLVASGAALPAQVSVRRFFLSVFSWVSQGLRTAYVRRMPCIPSQDFTVPLTFSTGNQRRDMNRKGKM